MIRDVVDIIKQVKDFENDGGNSLIKSLLNPASARPTIFKNATGMIAYFPILCSENIGAENLEKVRLGFEQEYASYLGLAVNATNNMSGEKTNAGTILSRVHNNELPAKGVQLGSVAGNVRSLLDESVKVNSITLEEDFNLELLEAKVERVDTYTDNSQNTQNKSGNTTTIGTVDKSQHITVQAREKTQEEIESEVALNKARTSSENAKTRTELAKADFEKVRTRIANRSQTIKTSMSTVQRTSNNQSAPTLINVSVPTANGVIETTYGIKCQNHILKADEIKKYTAETIKRKSMAFRLIQWYTGEIKMWKDIILNTSQSKKLALSSPWWKFLYNNAKINKFKAFIGNKYLMIPNATLILTEDEVSEIFREYGVEVEKNASVLVNELFLARLAIINEANGTINVYDERSKSFQRLTIKSVAVTKETDSIADLFRNIR